MSNKESHDKEKVRWAAKRRKNRALLVLLLLFVGVVYALSIVKYL